MAKPKEIRTLVVDWNPPINEVGIIKINLEGRLVDAEVLGINVEPAPRYDFPVGRSPNLQRYPTTNLIVRGSIYVPYDIGCNPIRVVTACLYLYVPELDKSL